VSDPRFAHSTLSGVCLLVTDGTHETPKTLEAGVAFIKAKEIVGGVIDFENCEYISNEDHLKVIARSKPEQGDTLFAHIGASLGEAAYVNTNREFSIKNVALFKPNPAKIDGRYLFYYIIAPRFQNEIKASRTGSAQPFVGLDSFRRHPIEYHRKLETQRKIAGMLSAYDDLIENNTHRIKILEQMAQVLYQEWFVRPCQSGRLPKGWEVKQVGDIVTLHRGKSYRSEDLADDGGLPFLNLKCMARDGGFRHEGIKRFHGECKDHHTAKAGDIVVAVTDMTQERRIVARAARVPRTHEPFYVMSMDLVRLSPIHGIPDAYLYSMLRYSKFPDEVKQHANGVNVLHLSPDRIGQFEFPLPDKARREAFGEFAEFIFEQCDVLNLKNANLRRTRDLLLPKLISGEVDVDRIEIPKR